ncbi:MAG: flagellar biosynthesis anti-sigma factor FlgM [Gallionellales bacterium RBG_16_57_15]|nr:MAG: flagellar biosynthesis anti-sigma factor FlgM [Gallionellales bacterium RBG_16_57_15]
MKIDKPGKPLPATPAGKAVTHAPARGKSTAPPSAAQQSDSTSVSLGSTATQLNSMTNASIVDTGKVAEIKHAISEGRFKVNSGAVADRLLETVRELIGGKT